MQPQISCKRNKLHLFQSILCGSTWKTVNIKQCNHKLESNVINFACSKVFFVVQHEKLSILSNATTNYFFLLEIWLWYHRISRLHQTLMILNTKRGEQNDGTGFHIACGVSTFRNPHHDFLLPKNISGSRRTVLRLKNARTHSLD